MQLVAKESRGCSVKIVQAGKRLTEEALEMVARRFAVLAEPMRLRLLMELMEGERNVGSLAEVAGSSTGNVSRHLQQLQAAGILRRRKDGLRVFYEIADPAIAELCGVVCGSLERQYAEQAAVMGRGR